MCLGGNVRSIKEVAVVMVGDRFKEHVAATGGVDLRCATTNEDVCHALNFAQRPRRGK